MSLDYININADKSEKQFKSLFDKCKDSLKDITELILKSTSMQHFSENININNEPTRNKNPNENIVINDCQLEEELTRRVHYFQNNQQNNSNNKEEPLNTTVKDETIQPSKEEVVLNDKGLDNKSNIENIIKNNIIKASNKIQIQQQLPNDNNTNTLLINEKLEKLKHLKAKKEQILNKNRRKNTGLTADIDPSDSCFNENVEIRIPSSNMVVNKPTNENNNFKLYTDEDEIDFEEDSQIILHFDKFNEKMNMEGDIENDQENKIDKAINDTIIEEGNSFLKAHKRSRSQIIQKQTFSYAVKPKRKHE